MRIGELARQLGVPPDTVRFYERAGWLPRAARGGNGYRDYGPADAEHLRLLLDLRRLDIPLEEAASLARSCHSGHCSETSERLPAAIARRRGEIAARIDGLRALDARLADLERHLGRRRPLPMAVTDGPCCEAAAEVRRIGEGVCDCCGPA
jgi:MerR family copper efflux transcriptional regulator